MAIRFMRTTALASAGASLLAAATLGACGANDGNPRGQTGGTAGSSGSTSGGSAGSIADASAGSSSGGTGATLFEGGLDVTPLDDSGLNEGSACTSTGAEATLVPVNVYLMVDISGSMSTLLSTVKLGLTQFFGDPQTAGLRVCINYFPKDSASTCDPLLFYTPEIPLGELTADPAPADAQEYALVSSISSKSVIGATPMYGALRGALDFSKDHVAAAPGEKMIVILTTDGSPNSCETAPDDQNDVDFIAGLAAHYWNAYGVATYTIGLTGSQEAEVKKIADNAGGKAFFLGGSANVSQDLIAALKAISGSLIACEYSIPEKTDAGIVDPTKVNVEFTDGNGVKKTFFKVDGPSQCVPDGWYYEYDASNTPISIKLCPAACTEVQNDGQSKITILLGCASVPPP
jgi:hypothetical protein